MARRELILTSYRAEMVVVPGKAGHHQAIRVTVFGTLFPQRALEPEILVGHAAAYGVSVAPDQRSVYGFLDELPADGASIRVRYGDSQEGVLREAFLRGKVNPLPKECPSIWP